jgi:transposase-like protein
MREVADELGIRPGLLDAWRSEFRSRPSEDGKSRDNAFAERFSKTLKVELVCQS